MFAVKVSPAAAQVTSPSWSREPGERKEGEEEEVGVTVATVATVEEEEEEEEVGEEIQLPL